MQENNRAKIKAAAVEVISKKGFFNTKMQNIADKAGLAVGTIYNYFSAKDELLKYIFETEMQRRIEFMSELEQKDLTIKELLLKFLTNHFSVLIDNPHLGRVLVREKDFSKGEEAGEIKQLMNLMIKALEELFEKAFKKGEIKKIDTHLMAIHFFGSMQGMIEYALTEPEIKILEKAPYFIMARIDHIFI